MKKRRIRTGDITQQANADEGTRRGDAIVIASQKGEETETTLGVNSRTITVR